MHNGGFAVMLIHTIFFMTHTSPKVLVVKVEEVETSTVRKSVEDYFVVQGGLGSSLILHASSVDLTV